MLYGRRVMIEFIVPRYTLTSYINSVGTNKKPRAKRFDGFTQNRLQTNREKCLMGPYPKNILIKEAISD